MTIGDQKYVVGPDAEPDKYRLLRQFGSGGEAELWESDLAFSGARERVAVKILRQHHAIDMTAWNDRWAEQAELLRLVRHPGVVGVHQHFVGPVLHLPGEADRGSRALYLVMNWVDGQDLREWAVGHRRAEDRVEGLRYLAQVADVLDWLHTGRATPSGRPVVHGDISPANVVINTDGQAVLVDFGLFRITRHVTVAPSGTPGYRAPELLQSGEYSPASDRYGFGALAYYVLVGDHPPEKANALAEALTQLLPAVSPTIAAELGRIASTDPAARPPASAWVRHLRMQPSTAPADGAPLRPPAPHHEPPASPAGGRAVPARGSRWRQTVVTCAVMVVVVLVVALVVDLTKQRPHDPGLTTVAGSPPPAVRWPGSSLSPYQPTPLPTSTLVSPTPPPRPARTVSLLLLQPETSELQQGAWTVDRVDYKQSLGCRDCQLGKVAVYPLAGGYTTFEATLATESPYEATMTITLDGRKTVRSATSGHPVPLNISVSGVQTMTISLYTQDYGELTILGRVALQA